jgi:hypothetical protein
MGLFGFLRRKDERAMPDPATPEFQETVRGSTLPGSELPASGELSWSSVGDAESAEDLGRRAAAELGLDPDRAPVDSTSQSIDLRGTGAREEMLEVLKQHGIDPDKEGQRIDASANPALQKAIVAVLRAAGVRIPGPGDKPNI